MFSFEEIVTIITVALHFLVLCFIVQAPKFKLVHHLFDLGDSGEAHDALNREIFAYLLPDVISLALVSEVVDKVGAKSRQPIIIFYVFKFGHPNSIGKMPLETENTVVNNDTIPDVSATTRASKKIKILDIVVGFISATVILA